MNNDLISREALLKAMEEERQFLLARGQTGAEHILVHHCLPIIDNAPTVDIVSPTIKVNIPEETKQKLIEELQKPHKLLVLPEPEVEYPFYQEAYQTGYEEGKNERPHGEWMPDKVAFYWVCSECGAEVRSNIAEVYLTEHTLNFCPNCGADMRGEE